MGTILLNNRHLSPFDILVKNFFQSEEQFQTPNNKIINHPVDIYEDENGIYFDIACTGLNKKQVNVDVEGDILKVSYQKSDKTKDDGLHLKLFIPLTPENKPKSVSIK